LLKKKNETGDNAELYIYIGTSHIYTRSGF